MDNQTQQPPTPIPPTDQPANPVPPKPPGKTWKKLLLFFSLALLLFVILLVTLAMNYFSLGIGGPTPAKNWFPLNTTITQTPTQKPTQTPNANWKTYNNRLHGFTMKYPADYRVTCDSCGSNQEDAEWASDVEFIPPASKGYGTITFVATSVEFERQPNETTEQYVIRRNNQFASGNASYSILKQLKINNTDAVQVSHTFKPDHPPYIVRTEFFFKDKPVDIHFNDASQTAYPDMRLPQAINTYPNFAVYEQMLTTFKTANLSQTMTIDDRYLPSPDKSYYVRKQTTLYEPTTILDKNGNVIVFDIYQSNGETIRSFKTNCHECSGEVGTWIDNKTLTIKIVGVSSGNFQPIAYEYRVDASTGKVDPNSFRQTK